MFKKSGVILLTVLVLSASIFAMGPWSTNTHGRINEPMRTEPLYRNLPDNATMSDVNLKGIVKEIKIEPGKGSEIILDIDGTKYEVHTGPIWMYEDLEEGMEMEITGKLVSVDNESYIVVSKAILKEVREDNIPVFARKGRNNGNVEDSYGRMGKNIQQNSRQASGRGMRGKSTNRGARYGNCAYSGN